MAQHPIRIVPPPHPIDEMTAVPGAASQPQLVYQGGPLLTSVQIFTLFWGSAWQGTDLAALASNVNDFFTYIVTSPLIDQLAEYNVPNYTIGYGTFAGTLTITDSDPNATVSDSDLQQFLQAQITAATVPAPNANLLYFIYLPPGVTVTLSTDQSCQAFCGYHSNIDTQTFYAIMPHPDCGGSGGCTGGLAILDALTSISSHELCEAITDPIPGQGWYDNSNGEIGDICAWQTTQSGNYTIQQEWSNNNNSCM